MTSFDYKIQRWLTGLPMVRETLAQTQRELALLRGPQRSAYLAFIKVSPDVGASYQATLEAQERFYLGRLAAMETKAWQEISE